MWQKIYSTYFLNILKKRLRVFAKIPCQTKNFSNYVDFFSRYTIFVKKNLHVKCNKKISLSQKHMIEPSLRAKSSRHINSNCSNPSATQHLILFLDARIHISYTHTIHDKIFNPFIFSAWDKSKIGFWLPFLIVFCMFNWNTIMPFFDI